MGIPCLLYGTRPEANNARNKKLNEVSPLADRFQKAPSYITATTGSNFISVREILHEGTQKITGMGKSAKEAESCFSREGRIPVTYQPAVPRILLPEVRTDHTTEHASLMHGAAATLHIATRTDGFCSIYTVLAFLPLYNRFFLLLNFPVPVFLLLLSLSFLHFAFSFSLNLLQIHFVFCHLSLFLCFCPSSSLSHLY